MSANSTYFDGIIWSICATTTWLHHYSLDCGVLGKLLKSNASLPKSPPEHRNLMNIGVVTRFRNNLLSRKVLWRLVTSALVVMNVKSRGFKIARPCNQFLIQYTIFLNTNWRKAEEHLLWEHLNILQMVWSLEYIIRSDVHLGLSSQLHTWFKSTFIDEVDILSLRETSDYTFTGKITARGDTQREILVRSRLFGGYQSGGLKKEAPHSCFKCNTMDHQIAECKVESATCGRSNQRDNVSASCKKPPHCKNCKKSVSRERSAHYERERLAGCRQAVHVL